MSNYNVSLPLDEFNRLKDVETKFNKGEWKIVYRDKIINNYSIHVNLFNSLTCIVSVSNEEDTKLVLKTYTIKREIELMIEDKLKNEYNVFKEKFENKIISDYEKNLSFSQKFKKLFL